MDDCFSYMIYFLVIATSFSFPFLKGENRSYSIYLCFFFFVLHDVYLIYVCLFFNRTGAVKAMIKTVYPSNHRILTLNGEMHMEFSFNMKPYSLYIRTYQYLQFCNLRWDQRMMPLYHIHIYIYLTFMSILALPTIRPL